jgi:hypothetical protein
MDARAIAVLRSSLEPLRRLGYGESGSLYAAPEFVALREICQKLYPGAGRKETLEFALSQALRNLGLLIGGPPHTELDWAAKRIDAAFRQAVSHRTHLCPLDLADELPDLQFGLNQIRTFTAAELADVVDPDGLSRNLPQWQSNIRRLSCFAWLVVTESVSLPANPGARALPLLFENPGFDRIELHKPKFLVAVEAALFAVLMLPWEDVAVYAKDEWRPFEVPWVHTIDDDLFARRMVVPDANTLNWAPDEERPERRLTLKDNAAETIHTLGNAFWAAVTTARESSLCARPFAHFFVRAFASEGIDEFLAHITVVEAALGLALDHDSRSRPKFGRKNPGATDRVSWRVAGILHDAVAGERYRELFKERSDFLHGQAKRFIPTKSRLDARRLARRCVCALIEAARTAEDDTDPDSFLHNLLLRGRASS